MKNEKLVKPWIFNINTTLKAFTYFPISSECQPTRPNYGWHSMSNTTENDKWKTCKTMNIQHQNICIVAPTHVILN